MKSKAPAEHLDFLIPKYRKQTLPASLCTTAPLRLAGTAMGCKRIIMDPGYLDALNRPNVDLITSPIDTVTEKGILTQDGREHEFDVLILATGFDFVRSCRPAIQVRMRWLTAVLYYHTAASPLARWASASITRRACQSRSNGTLKADRKRISELRFRTFPTSTSCSVSPGLTALVVIGTAPEAHRNSAERRYGAHFRYRLYRMRGELRSQDGSAYGQAGRQVVHSD